MDPDPKSHCDLYASRWRGHFQAALDSAIASGDTFSADFFREILDFMEESK